MTSHALAATSGDQAPSVAAADAWSRALDSFLRAAGDPLAQVDALLQEHPSFDTGHVLRSAIAVAAKDPQLLALVDDASAAEQRAPARWSKHARAHLRAARAWRRGAPLVAAERYTAVLREWPHDVVALRLAQSCYFQLGRRAALRDVVDLVWDAWDRDRPGFEYVLAMAAFACAENGDAHCAEAFGRRALKMQPCSPFAIHAVAHALFDRGEHASGAAWMREQEPQWSSDSRMSGHNAWHLAMFELASGFADRAMTILDDRLMPAASTSAGDAADATSLLWRLELEGLHPGSRWAVLSDSWAAHSQPGFWAFLDVHAAIAFNAAGDFDRAQWLKDAIAQFAKSDTHAGRVAVTVTSIALQAIQAFTNGCHAKTRMLLQALRPALAQLGGSHVQHDVFARMLHRVEAALHRSHASGMAPAV